MFYSKKNIYQHLLDNKKIAFKPSVQLNLTVRYHDEGSKKLSRPGITGYILHIVTFNLAIIIHILEEVALEPILGRCSKAFFTN
jgi:hypothetical protein